MKDKIVFTFAELDYIYDVVKNAVNRYEEPILKPSEMVLQYSEENAQKIKERHLKELQQNEHYLKMVELKEKLEKIELVLNIEE